MRRHTTLSLLATSLTMAAAAFHDDARAQQGYGYPEHSGPAAPSTIPGQGDSSARVPVVDSAPAPMPKPRKPKPGAKPSPWGGAPPVATQPPVASQPPAGPSPGSGGNPPPPAQSTPMPSQPQGGASDRLTGTFRGSSGVASGAVSRKGDASGSGIDGSAQRTTSTVLACTQNGNTPKVTRIRPASDAALKPGATFIVEGLCFGDARGKVQVTLPTQYGRIQANEAQVLDWDGDKILAQLPEGIVKATPGAASVEIVSAAGTRGAGKDIGFEPRWEKRPLRDVEGSIVTCKVPNTPTTFHRCSIEHAGAGVVMKSTHWRGDTDLHPIRAGSDRYDFRLPDWMRPAGCSITFSASATDGTKDGRATTRFEGKSAIVEWAFTETADSDAFLTYDLSCDVWTPAGVERQ
jgi:hypothetical protein